MQPIPMEPIRLSKDKRHFIKATSGERFLVWGVNYDRDYDHRLLEDYWHDEWEKVERDFREAKALGANVIRVHLQLGKFLPTPDTPNPDNLDRLARLLRLAERTGIYLNVTGQGCYHRRDVPEWYDALDEGARWAIQARFWEAVVKTCVGSPAVFCYNLMNEPVLPLTDEHATDWLAGELEGKFYVQRIVLDLAGRAGEQVAAQWINTLVAAVRRHDTETLVTVGEIPWVMDYPDAKPVFYSPEASGNLDFVSVHFYPKHDRVDDALQALAVYNIGKPLVIEEMFPLECNIEELGAFVDGSRPIADGWVGFFWGKTLEEYAALETPTLGDTFTLQWLTYFRDKKPEILGGE